MFLIDIAVPRNIEPDAGKLDNVFLYDIDDLDKVVDSNLRGRSEVEELGKGERARRGALKLAPTNPGVFSEIYLLSGRADFRRWA